MKSEFQFQLSTPVKYHAKGEEIEGSFITLKAPSYKQMDKCVPLKQAFYRVAAAASAAAEDDTSPQEPTDSDSPSELDSDTLISMFYQSSEDMVKIILHGVELFKSGIAQIDGSHDMKAHMIEQMSQDDLEQMIGCYMINFILASALNKQESKSG